MTSPLKSVLQLFRRHNGTFRAIALIWAQIYSSKNTIIVIAWIASKLGTFKRYVIFASLANSSLQQNHQGYQQDVSCQIACATHAENGRPVTHFFLDFLVVKSEFRVVDKNFSKFVGWLIILGFINGNSALFSIKPVWKKIIGAYLNKKIPSY